MTEENKERLLRFIKDTKCTLAGDEDELFTFKKGEIKEEGALEDYTFDCTAEEFVEQGFAEWVDVKDIDVKSLIKRPIPKRDYAQDEDISEEIIKSLRNGIYVDEGKFKAPILAKDITYSEYNPNDGTGIQRGFLVTNDNKTMMFYTGGYYKDDGEDITRNVIQQVLKDDCTEYRKKEVIGNIKDDGNLRIDREVFDNNKDFVNLQNCIYNLKTGKTEDHCMTYFFSNQLPIRYDPNAKIDKIKTYLEEILPLNYIKIIQQFFGDCLLGDYRYKKAIMAAGVKNTGKSTLFDLLKRFLGEDNVSNIELSALCYDKFTPWHLYRKQANICSQIESAGIKQMAKFLMLTGGCDRIYAQKKGKDGFFFINKAKLIFGCNVIPEFKVVDDAVYYRWIVVPFENVFEGKDAKRNILDEICTETEMSGLFNWAIEGLRQLEKQNDYSECMSLEEIKDFMTQGKNPVREFVDANIETHIGIELKEHIYKCYRQFCEFFKYPVLASNAFSRKFKEYAPISMTEGQKHKGGKRTWKGIKCTYDQGKGTDKQQKVIV